MFKWNKNEFLTLRSIVKAVPGSSVSLVLSIGENLCLFSSQFSSLLFFRELKLVEVHHERLKHAWLQDNKLDETTVLTVWSVKRLFSLSMELAESKFSSVAKTAEAMILNKIWSENIIFFAGHLYLWARR